MTIARGFALLLCVLPCATACRETPRAKAAELRQVEATRKQELSRRIAMADANPAKAAPLAMWIMPPELKEISGLALTTHGTVLAHDDNIARIYEIDPKTGILLKGFSLNGLPHGDFEAITIAGPDIYLLHSKGRIYKFKEGADAGQVPYTVYDPGLGKECEFESMAYEADSSRLLLVCKQFLGKNDPHELLIYRLPLPFNRSTMSTLRVPIEDVIGSNKWKDFHPSDINIDPITKNYVIVASHEKGLLMMTPKGNVVRSEPLPDDHRQPEGVAITRDSILIVSDEANVKPPAITLYRWRP